MNMCSNYTSRPVTNELIQSVVEYTCGCISQVSGDDLTDAGRNWRGAGLLLIPAHSVSLFLSTAIWVKQ